MHTDIHEQTHPHTDTHAYADIHIHGVSTRTLVRHVQSAMSIEELSTNQDNAVSIFLEALYHLLRTKRRGRVFQEHKGDHIRT